MGLAPQLSFIGWPGQSFVARGLIEPVEEAATEVASWKARIHGRARLPV